MARERERQSLSVGKKIVFSLLTTLFFVGLAEVGVRTWAHYLREEYERFDPSAGTFTLVPGRHRNVGGWVVVNEDEFVGAPLREPGPDLFRIVAIGDSNTFGVGNEHDTYPAMMGKLLDERAPDGRRFDVVNAGIQGFDSTMALRRLRARVLPLQPDVVTIYVGWNDLMKFDPMGQEGASAVASASRFVDRLWLVKGMRKLSFFYLRPYLDPPAVGPESRTGRFTAFVPLFFIDNLRTMIAEIRASGAEVVLTTLTTALRPEMTTEDIQQAGIYFPYYPAAYGVGDLLDLVAAYNRAVRLVAEEEKVALVELDRAFDAREDYRDLFFDTMHATDPGRWLMAHTFVDTLERANLLGDPPLRKP